MRGKKLVQPPIWLPYVAIGVSLLVLLFGNNVVGNSHANSNKTALALLALELGAQKQEEATERQLIMLNNILTRQGKQWKQLNDNSADIAVIHTRLDNYIRLLSAEGGLGSDGYSKWLAASGRGPDSTGREEQ